MPVILIVEDDFFIRELSELTIQDLGYETLSASDEQEALAHLRSPRRIDVLFTDLNLRTNRIGGCELARVAIGLRPDLRVLYTTGNLLTPEMRSHFIANTQCLVKPYTSTQLQSSLRGFAMHA